MSVISEHFDRLGLAPDGSIDASRTYRLGIMGGTFDPIHIGHLACAEQARDAFDLDAVLFIPAGQPVFKKHQKVTCAADRLEMCRLACADNPAFDVSPIEIERGGDTYTIDTLHQLRDYYPENVELYFITGADAMLSIVSWRNSQGLSKLAHLIAATRPGFVMSDEYRRTLAEHGCFDVSYLEMTALSVSSSMLRAWVGQGKSIRYLCPQGVWQYIQDRGLYRASGLGE